MKTLSANIVSGFLLLSMTGLGMISLRTVQAVQTPPAPAASQTPPAPAASQTPPVPAVKQTALAPAAKKSKSGKTKKSKKLGLPAGTAKIWEDRGELNPRKVYWGAASLTADPLVRLPAPPFSKFEPDVNGVATSPKVKVTDSKKVKWTAKFGVENRADTIAPRLAWALGFGAVEGYYIQSGVIQDYNPNSIKGNAKILTTVIKPNGAFDGGGRFKRHDKTDEPVKDAKGGDMYWDEAHNPGVPPEQLSGLLIFEVLVRNWDSQPKNCKVYHTTGPSGPENWYIVSDLGASFADAPRHKFVLADYQKDPVVIKHVSRDTVELNFVDVIHSEGKIHEHVPLAHAQWFRKQLAKLTEDEIQAAFDAGYATEGLNKAYATGDPAQIKAARAKELSPQARADIAAYVAVFRAKIAEYMQKIPPGS
jgi:hypothetical protein